MVDAPGTLPEPPTADPAAQERAEHLKERVYITFTALAVVLAQREHAESAGRAP